MTTCIISHIIRPPSNPPRGKMESLPSGRSEGGSYFKIPPVARPISPNGMSSPVS